MDDQEPNEESRTARRAVLRLGAIGSAAVLTIRPGLAQAATSVLTCTIAVPDPGRAGQWVAPDGSIVAPNTAGAFAPPPAPLKGEDVRNALRGRALPGADPQASQAYMRYVSRLQHGQSGFTCYASLQMPGR